MPPSPPDPARPPGPAPRQTKRVFTVPAGQAFAPALAAGLKARFAGYSLDQIDIYLPTRRATRSFVEVFARESGGATLLPEFKALGDADEDELLLGETETALELPPAIDEMRRRMLLAVLIRRWDENRPQSGRFGFAQAMGLAKSLASVMDEAETAGADLSKLDDLAPEALAAHWAEVKDFLSLIGSEWPKLLAVEGRLNPADRRNRALAALADRLSARPPDHPVIVAGTTAAIPAVAGLVGAIAGLPLGAVVLPGLDRDLDEKSWKDLDPGHPQYGLKQLLGRLGVKREEVADWAPAADAPPACGRAALWREVLRPAPTTDAWRALAEGGDETIAAGLKGLSLFEAADPAEEAAAIALMLRESLETPGKTAALVTRDRALARRVTAELKRWNIAIDDTAGRPLSRSPAGSFLALTAEAAEADFAPVPLIALLQHPYAGMNDRGRFRGFVHRLDRALRGPRPDGGLDGIAVRLSRVADEAREAGKSADADDLGVWFAGIAETLRPLAELYARPHCRLSDLLDTHIRAAEALAAWRNPNADGQSDPPETDLKTPWEGTAGNAAALFVQRLRPAAEGLPEVDPGGYASAFRDMMAETAVRPFGSHPRLAILGPLESRLIDYDRIVLGGLNEGVWPPAAGADPWFSRQMRARLGLEQPERAIGVTAHDFAALASGPEVFLTRAGKSGGTPTVASRWLQRLEQLTRGLGLYDRLAPALDYDGILRALNDTGKPEPIAPPAPRPPVAARPRHLSVTEIETWLRDPYAIYAKHVLKLRRLDPLDDEIGAPERGTILHRALERFLRACPHEIPADAPARLVGVIDDLFAEEHTPAAVRTLWRPRFIRAAGWFVHRERERRETIAESFVEITGKLTIHAPGGDFLLTGKADRIDRLKAGGGAILDYKTGAPPSEKQVAAQLSPQLPLEAVILAAGGFAEIGPLKTANLVYVKISGGNPPGEWKPIRADAATLAADAASRLEKRIAEFDDPATAYDARVAPQFAKYEGDYDHLARVREWSATGWSGDET